MTSIPESTMWRIVSSCRRRPRASPPGRRRAPAARRAPWCRRATCDGEERHVGEQQLVGRAAAGRGGVQAHHVEVGRMVVSWPCITMAALSPTSSASTRARGQDLRRPGVVAGDTEITRPAARASIMSTRASWRLPRAAVRWAGRSSHRPRGRDRPRGRRGGARWCGGRAGERSGQRRRRPLEVVRNPLEVGVERGPRQPQPGFEGRERVLPEQGREVAGHRAQGVVERRSAGSISKWWLARTGKSSSKERAPRSQTKAMRRYWACS